MAIPLYIKLDKIGSTNEFAVLLTSKTKPPEGSVISAQNQYKGRGQVGRSWVSAPRNNITLSIILYPNDLPIKKQFYLNIVISLAVAEVVSLYCTTDHVKVKYPNDVYIGEEKIAGLLIQCSLSGSQIQNAILGIGLNVLQKTFPAYLPNPTSMILHSKELPSLRELENEVHEKVMFYYGMLKKGDFDQLKGLYESRLYEKGAEQYWGMGM